MREKLIEYYESQFPCECSEPRYTDTRGLHAEGCLHHFAADFVDGLMPLVSDE